MLQRAARALVTALAVACLGGCVVHGRPRTTYRTRTRPPATRTVHHHHHHHHPADTHGGTPPASEPATEPSPSSAAVPPATAPPAPPAPEPSTPAQATAPPEHRHGPPDHAPAHGYRRKAEGGAPPGHAVSQAAGDEPPGRAGGKGKSKSGSEND